jgi:predicted Zn-dependent peptidase
MRINGRAIALLAVAVLAASALGAYSAVELDRSNATCDQLNDLIGQHNAQGAVLRRLLLNAARTREATALLREQSSEARRINQRAAYLYRLDASRIHHTGKVTC